jgi:hypothetical protein
MYPSIIKICAKEMDYCLVNTSASDSVHFMVCSLYNADLFYIAYVYI